MEERNPILNSLIRLKGAIAMAFGLIPFGLGLGLGFGLGALTTPNYYPYPVYPAYPISYGYPVPYYYPPRRYY